MITINLLRTSLVSERRFRQRLQVEAAVGILLFVSVLVGCGGIWLNLNQTLQQLQVAKQEQQSRLASIKQSMESFESLDQQREALTSRILQVKQLALRQERPIRLLELVSRSLEPLNIWLVSFQTEQESVTLSGLSVSRLDILELAQTLGKNELFQNVKVLETRAEPDQLGLYHFSMDLQMRSSPIAQPSA